MLIATTANAATNPTLPRRTTLGIVGVPPSAEAAKGKAGVLIDRVTPGLTGEKIGLRSGDLLVAINGTPVATPPELTAAAAKLMAGDQLRMSVVRGGKKVELKTRALPRPYESYIGASTKYGAVPFDGGLLRDILVTPDKPAPGKPILFIIQGFTCASIDYLDINDTHRQLTQRLVAEGIGVYRVEKAGVGDSQSPKHCKDMDFDEELAGFKAAYRNLSTAYGIEPDQTFMLGHSLGGLEAPLMAAETPPRGVSVYGTVLRNWMDYYLDVIRFQATELGRGDPVMAVQLAEELRPMLTKLFVDRRSFGQLAQEKPEYASAMRDVLGWQGGDALLGRNSAFWQDLSAAPLAAGWRDTKSRVLSLYGESDLVALNDEDHKLIALIVNRYRPGTAKYVEIAGAEHDMTQVGNPDAVRRAVAATGAIPPTQFEPKVAEVIIGWIKDSMAQPAVRTLTFPEPANMNPGGGGQD